MKSNLRYAAALVIGLVLLIGGISEINNESVDCGGSAMSPGDICTVSSNGSENEYTYDEQKASNQRTGYIMVGIGGLLFVVVGGALVTTAVRRRRSTAVS